MGQPRWILFFTCIHFPADKEQKTVKRATLYRSSHHLIIFKCQEHLVYRRLNLLNFCVSGIQVGKSMKMLCPYPCPLPCPGPCSFSFLCSFESAIATPQLEGNTSAIAIAAIPQLSKACYSAIAPPQS